MTTTDADVIADQVLPFGGPYDPAAIEAAARAISELVRRLNHATFGNDTFQYPAQLDNVMGSVRAAVIGLDQLFNQLDQQLSGFSANPALYAYGRDVTVEVTLARIALSAARASATDLGNVMARACSSLNRLGLND